MIFLLGLGYIPRVFPWATLALIIANVYFYIPNLRDQLEAQNKIIAAQKKYRIDSVVNSAFYAQCAQLYTYKDCFLYGETSVMFMLQKRYYEDPNRQPLRVKVQDEFNNKVVELEIDFEKDLPMPPEYKGKWPISQFRETKDYTNLAKWYYDYSKFYIQHQDKKDKIFATWNRVKNLNSQTEVYLKGMIHKQNLQNYREELKNIHKEFNLQSGSNLTSTSSFKSMFSHASLGHLAGNMFFLLLFGLFLEAKMGILLFASGYLITGILGGIITSFVSDPLVYCVGASIAISGLIGMYYILFFNEKLLLKAYYIAFRKNAYIDNSVWFPWIYFATDMLMGFGTNASTGVSHIGHAIGAILGLIAAYIYQAYLGDVLPQGFHYTYQLAKWKEAIIDGTLKRLITESKKLLECNPYNFSLRESLIKRASPLIFHSMDPYDHVYFFQNYQKYIESLVAEKNIKKIIEHSEKLIQGGQLVDVMFYFEPNVILKLGDIMVKNKKNAEATAYYDLYVRRFPNAQIAKSVRATLSNLAQMQDQAAAIKTAA